MRSRRSFRGAMRPRVWRSRLLLLLLLLASGSRADFSFVVVGDWGSGGSGNDVFAETQKDVAAGMATVAKSLGSSFIVSVGDNFYEDGVASTSDARWKAAFRDIYTQKSLNVPWYIALGNHDYMGVIQAQLDYNKDDRWNLPDRNYSVVLSPDGNVTLFLVVIDTTPFIRYYYTNPENSQMVKELRKQDWKPQILWLEQTLQRSSNYTWTVVVGHHPIISSKQGRALDGPFNGGFAELQAHVRPLLEKYGVHAYFCGHLHNLQHLNEDGVHYFISGGGSRLEPESARKRSTTYAAHFFSEKPGFQSVVVTPSSLITKFHNAQAAVVYSVNISIDEKVFVGDDKILGMHAWLLFLLVVLGMFVLIGLAVFAARRSLIVSQAQYRELSTDPSQENSVVEQDTEIGVPTTVQS